MEIRVSSHERHSFNRKGLEVFGHTADTLGCLHPMDAEENKNKEVDIVITQELTQVEDGGYCGWYGYKSVFETTGMPPDNVSEDPKQDV